MSDPEKTAGDKTIELLRFNYENLNTAVWEAHKITWLMTSIFIPIIFGGLALILKDSENIPPEYQILAMVLFICITWFWFSVISLLAEYNKKRFEQLRKIEDFFNKCLLVKTGKIKQFAQYDEQMHTGYRLRFSVLAVILSIALTVISVSGIGFVLIRMYL